MAAVYYIWIEGIRRYVKSGSLRITEQANGQNRCDFSIDSPDPPGAPTPWRPLLGQELSILQMGGDSGGNMVFGGYIESIMEGGQGQIGWSNLTFNISALDYSSLAKRRTISARIPGPVVLRDLLRDHILPYLAPYGVHMDPSHPPGPTLEGEQVWEFATVEEILNRLSEATHWIWDIGHDKYLRMYEPASTMAPFHLTWDDKKVIGDLTTETSLENYGNRVIVRFTEAAIPAWGFLTAESVHADETVTVGGTTYTWVEGTPTEANQVQIGATVEDSFNNLAAAFEGTEEEEEVPEEPEPEIKPRSFGPGTNKNGSVFGYFLRYDWFVGPMLKVIAREAGESGNNIEVNEEMSDDARWIWEGNIVISGEHLMGGKDEALTNWVEANNAAEQTEFGVTELVISAPDIRTYEAAQALANANLETAVASRAFKRLKYTTEKSFQIHPGMVQNINIPQRDLAGQYLITDISIFENGNWVRREISAQGGVLLAKRWVDDAKSALGSGQSSSSIAGSIAVAGGGGGGGGGGAEEVSVGPDEPAGAIELWYDTDATGGPGTGGGGAASGMPSFMGGSRSITRTGPGPIAEWAPVILEKVKLPTGKLNIYGELAILSGGGTCDAVLTALSGSVWSEVGRAAPGASSTPGVLFFEFVCDALPGRVAYRLEVAPSNPAARVACMGQVIGI